MTAVRQTQTPILSNQGLAPQGIAAGLGKNRRLSLFLVLLLALPALAGCHSAHVETTITNQTTAPISVVQVEYPSASFGTQSIAPGQDFHYRFKILGSGQMKITYTDSAEKEHTFSGPTLVEGSEGNLRILVTTTGVQWQPSFTSK